MSVTCKQSDFASIMATSSSYAISAESNTLQDSIQNIRRHYCETASGQQIARVRASLVDVFLDCRLPNWDGYNATPISKKAYIADILASGVSSAGRELKLMPDTTPHLLHANITGWPEQKSEQKLIAIKLASKSNFCLHPKSL